MPYGFLATLAFAGLISSGSTLAADVIFTNTTNKNLEVHVRNGPVNQHPDDRGSRNSTVRPGEVWANDVGDGDTWFAYGNQIVNSNDNPPLCNAEGGVTVNLDKSHQCFVDN